MRLGAQCCLFTLVICSVLFSSALARELLSSKDSDGSSGIFALQSSFQVFGLASLPSSDPALSSSETSWSILPRFRLEPIYHFSKESLADFAYDQRLTVSSTSATPGSLLAILPSNSPAPFRLTQAGGVIFTQGNTNDYHEIDRLFVAWQPRFGSVIVGRQAIGWGRGMLFGAVDIFSPFTPLEIDREWRRGVDAVRADVKLSNTFSIDMVGAFAPSWDQSALGSRLRGYFGNVDGELIVAKRATDTLLGITSSAAVGDFSVYGEFGAFLTPGDIPDDSLFGNSTWIPKAVLGLSDNINWKNGIKATAEYHYSGFGVANLSTLPQRLADPSYQTRILRGDTQIPGKRAGAVSLEYTFNEQWTASFQWLESFVDFSGVLVPSATWDISEQTSILSLVYLGYGAGSIDLVPQSQFGAVSPTLIVQLRIYD